MLVLVCLFGHLPAGILCLYAVICMAVQSTPNSQIPECKLFYTQCKAYIVQNLCDFLPLPVLLFIAKPGDNGRQDKDASSFLRLAPALSSNQDTWWTVSTDFQEMLQELSVLLSCQGVQGVGGGMWKLKLITRIGIVSGEEESLAYFVEIFEWLHCIIHILWTMNQHIKKKKTTEKTS